MAQDERSWPHLQVFICALTSRRLRTRPWITVGSGARLVLPALLAVGSAGMLPSVGRLTVVKQMLYSCIWGTRLTMICMSAQQASLNNAVSVKT